MDLTVLFYIVISLHGAIMFGAYFVSIPILFNLHIFDNLNIFQEDAAGVFAIIEMCFALASLIIYNVSYYVRDRKDYTPLNKNTKKITFMDNTTSKVLVFFYGCFFVGSIVFLLLRLGALGVLHTVFSSSATETCLDTSWESGCPTTRYDHFQSDKITEKQECAFLAYNEKNITTAGSVIDWSLKENYDANKRKNILGRVNLNLNIACVNNKCSKGTCFDGRCIMSEEDLPRIHWCYYWGCNQYCNDRYVLNQTWLFLSLINSIFYLTVMVFMIVTLSAATTTKEKVDDVEIEVADQISSKGSDSGNDSKFMNTIF